MANRKMSGISATTLLIGGAAVLAVGYLLTRPKTTAPTVIYQPPVNTGSQQTTTSAINAGASVLNNLFDNLFG